MQDESDGDGSGDHHPIAPIEENFTGVDDRHNNGAYGDNADIKWQHIQRIGNTGKKRNDI